LDKLLINHISAEDYIRTSDKKFDLIFLDPPYNKGFISPIISSIVKNGLLSDDGIIVLESDNTDEHGEFLGLSVLKQRKYGRTFVTVYKRGDER
jgi:16S rRNA (guanine966-N2)-methyltransferase